MVDREIKVLDGSECKKILIVKLSSIGDVVMATPVAKALRTAYPNAHLTWIVEKKSAEVLIDNPYLDEVIVWDRPMIADLGFSATTAFPKSLSSIKRQLRSTGYDVAIDLQGLLRSAVVTWLSGARYRIGYESARECAPLFYNVQLPKSEDIVMDPQQYLNILRLLDLNTADLDMHMHIGVDDAAFANNFVSETRSRYPDKKLIVSLCPATTWPQKHWTESGWAKLADSLFRDYSAVPIFMGSKADIPMITRIQSMMKYGSAVATGKTTLSQAAAIVKESDLVVAVDTGLLHMSMALKRPSVALFGPTRMNYLDRSANAVVVTKDIQCEPCLRRPTCKNYDCMHGITADDVLNGVDSLLKGVTAAK